MDPHERKKLKRMKAMSDSEEDEEDDEERLREELGVRFVHFEMLNDFKQNKTV